LINRADGALLVVRSGKTRYAVVDRLLEQLPRERMLGVVLNRAETAADETAYYYSQRRYQAMTEADDEAEAVSENETDLDMIYIDESVVS
jgi:Mrp family chromosome partitioning ATPase